MKTNELSGAALDWAVAKAIGEYKPVEVPNYSTDWAQGGPIIEREWIELSNGGDSGPLNVSGGPWVAYKYDHNSNATEGKGPTPLIAGMRCYVSSKLGDEVEIPSELLEAA